MYNFKLCHEIERYSTFYIVLRILNAYSNIGKVMGLSAINNVRYGYYNNWLGFRFSPYWRWQRLHLLLVMKYKLIDKV